MKIKYLSYYYNYTHTQNIYDNQSLKVNVAFYNLSFRLHSNDLHLDTLDMFKSAMKVFYLYHPKTMHPIADKFALLVYRITELHFHFFAPLW